MEPFFEKEISNYALLTPEQERALTRRVREGDEVARHKMINHNLRLVASIAKDFLKNGIPFDELMQEGSLGLMEALRRFDPEMGNRFSTYATPWIKESLRRAVSTHGQTVKISPYMREMIFKFRQTMNRLTAKSGTQPSDQEVAAVMGVPKSTLQLILQASKATISVHQPIGGGNEQSIGDGLPDHRFPTPEERFLRQSDAKVVHRHLARLKPRESEVLKMRFGLDGADQMTLKEIGKQLKLTKERVRQIENQAKRRLKRILGGLPGVDR